MGSELGVNVWKILVIGRYAIDLQSIKKKNSIALSRKTVFIARNLLTQMTKVLLTFQNVVSHEKGPSSFIS